MMPTTGYMSVRRERGFTLLELLVALSIFAVVSVLSYGGLQSVLNAREHSNVQTERLAALQIAVQMLSRDIEQVVKRGVRDQFGDKQSPMTANPTSSNGGLEFTKTGWRNPAGFARSNLQRVGYNLRDDKLIRSTWPMLDRAQASAPREAVILENVKEFSVRFLDSKHEWQSYWPPTTTAPANIDTLPLPNAVEIAIDLEDWGLIKRIFRVAHSDAPDPAAGGAPPPPPAGGSPPPGQITPPPPDER